MTLKNKKILIIVGGGIAAYKSLDLIRMLKKMGRKLRRYSHKVVKNLLRLYL